MENSIKIKARTTYTRSSLMNIQYYHMFWVGFRGKLVTCCVALILIIGIFSVVSPYFDSSISTSGGWYLLLFGVLMIIMPLIVTYSAFSKKGNVLYAAVTDNTFYEDHFTVEIKKEFIDMMNDVKFAGITRVYEAKNCFYIYISKTQVFIVTKEGFTVGTPEELSALLCNFIPAKKFHKYNKK